MKVSPAAGPVPARIEGDRSVGSPAQSKQRALAGLGTTGHAGPDRFMGTQLEGHFSRTGPFSGRLEGRFSRTGRRWGRWISQGRQL